MAAEYVTAEQADDQDDEFREILLSINAQVRANLELTRSLVNLLMPKEGSRQGPTLEQMLSALMAQQRELIQEVKQGRDDLVRIAEALPQAVVEAAKDRRWEPAVVMNFRKIAAASKGQLLLRYFTENTPEPIHPQPVDAEGRVLDSGGRLTAYYTGRDSRASWRTDMPKSVAAAAGINPNLMPRDSDLARLFEGKRGDDGEPWSRFQRKLSGFDIVFSPHKSVSLAAEFARTPAESAAILNAMDRANDGAMRYVGQVLGWARKGAGGEDGLEPGAVGWISFRHHTARPTLHVQDGPGGATYLMDAPVAGDPHSHIHNFLMNLVVTADGRIGSLDTRLLTQDRVKEFGAFFQALLADELRRLGIAIDYDAGQQAVVVSAIPEIACKTFSKRDREVLTRAKAFAAGQGLVWEDLSAEQKMAIVEDASSTGKLGKLKSDERASWLQQAEAIGWSHETAIGARSSAPLTKAERLDQAYDFAARGLATEFHTAAVIAHEKLGMYAARGLIGTGIVGGVADIKAVVGLLEKRGIEIGGEQVRLVTGLWDDQVRVTNTAQIRIEEKLAATAQASCRDKTAALSSEAVAKAMAATGIAFEPEQRAAVHALGEGGAITMLTGVAGAGKTTLLKPLVAAWKADARFEPGGREVIGAAMAWRQADELREAGLARTYAIQPLLAAIDSGDFVASQNTVLVLDEVSQIGPRAMLKLLEAQAKTGMTIKMLGDREQAQSIEAGDSIEILRRVLPAEAQPELLKTMRQATERGREVATLFRQGDASTALAMKRDDGHAVLLGGDHGEVVGQIADFAVARMDVLRSGGSKASVTVSAPTNADVAEISLAIRQRLKRRGEIANDERTYRAIDQRGETFDLPIATGDRVRLFQYTHGMVDGQLTRIGSNGHVVEVLGTTSSGLRIRTADGRAAEVAWRRLEDKATGRLKLGHGHVLTIDAAQGITSPEHINALPRGTSGVTGFKTYVAESRSRGTTWTLISEGALFEAERHRQALGDITPITKTHLWARAAEDMSRKPYKSLGVDLLHRVRQHRDEAADVMIAASHAIESARLADADCGHQALQRARDQVASGSLPDTAKLARTIQANGATLAERTTADDVERHLQATWATANRTKREMKAAPARGAAPSNGPCM